MPVRRAYGRVGSHTRLSEVLSAVGVWFLLRARKADVAAAEASETAQEFNIALNVKQQYNAILAAKEQEAAARAQLALAEQQLQVSIARVNAGAANVSDSRVKNVSRSRK